MARVQLKEKMDPPHQYFTFTFKYPGTMDLLPVQVLQIHKPRLLYYYLVCLSSNIWDSSNIGTRMYLYIYDMYPGTGSQNCK